ncbi:MAG: TetR/AcrR family transcriptional regulator, partial [Solirubrobacteraceae bacterium]
RRVEAAIAAIAARAADDRPVDLLLRALATGGPASDELLSPTAALRLRLMDTVPAVRGRSLQMQRAAQREIAARLCAAYPDVDRASANALVGAFIGAVGGVLDALLEDPATGERDAEELLARVRETVAGALTNVEGRSGRPAHD